MKSWNLTLCTVIAGTLSLSAACVDSASVRERLTEAGRVSGELKAKASALPDNVAVSLGIEADVPEERGAENPKRFARQSEADAYVRARPWSAEYASAYRAEDPPAVDAWPTAQHTAALRDLLGDRDVTVKCLAIEALATLAFPEDVPRIAALLNDQTPGAVVLGWSEQQSSQGWQSLDADPLLPKRTWRVRTVQTYARQALQLMTGHRFDGADPEGITFAAWWKTHNFGKESLWYWQQRLSRHETAMAPVERKPGESAADFQKRSEEFQAAFRAKLHAADLKEIGELSPDAEAKIFLMTTDHDEEDLLSGPVSPFFPGGIKLRIGLPQLMEIVEGKRAWPDGADVEDARRTLLARVGRLAPQLLIGIDDPEAYRIRIRAVLEREASETRWMPIVVSRLLPPATAADMDNPKTRDGYLRRALASAKDGFARERLAAEMVRSNLAGNWTLLEKVFQSEQLTRGETSDARQGILEALGEAPHTPEKARVLATLIEDPRNLNLFTSPNLRMGMDMYRRYAVASVNAIAGKELVSFEVLQDLGTPERSKEAMAALTRAAKELNGSK